jgi:predicted chitinase
VQSSTATLPPSGDVTVDKVIEALRVARSAGVFEYEKANNVWEPSDLYTWADMTDAVHKMATKGVGKLKLWVGGDDHIYGLVNIAAFLAQVMQETIRYNACDENNWSDLATMTDGNSLVGAVYPATAACGQLHQSYQHYQCSAEEDLLAGGQMACDVDPDMETRATTRASWYGSPPELFCAPKSKVPKAPRWSTGGWCSPADQAAYEKQGLDRYLDYVNSGGKCQDYQGQQAGHWTLEGEHCTEAGCANMAAPLFNNTPARTDVEGCCWWGRGAIQTTGVCNFGKLNFFMGKRAADEGREAIYPDSDFCKTPWSICDPEGPPELKWVAGFFYWLNAVQPYSSKGWVYADHLKAWVDGGRSRADNAFIDGASGIVNRGCHDANCGTGHLHAKTERRNNFYKVLDAMGL